MAECDWTVSWWLFWRVFRVLESSVKKDFSELQLNGGCDAILRALAQSLAPKGERHTLERILGLAQSQVSGLLKSREGLIDAGDGELVGLYVEVADCVVNELRRISCEEYVFDGSVHTVAGSSSRSIVADNVDFQIRNGFNRDGYSSYRSLISEF